MSKSSDAGHFFQTTSALNETARKAQKAKNKKGNPIKLPSKILAVVSDPKDGGHVFVAEAAGNVKRIKLETGDILATYSGPTAPLTSIALSPTSDTVFAGCWDKTIWSWSISSRKPSRRFQGHTDFVKALLALALQGKELLVSGSADATIIIWDIASGSKLHTLKGHSRGILALALDPTPSSDSNENEEEVIFFSAGTDREIHRWTLTSSSAAEIPSTDDVPSPLIRHETSIDSLFFDADADADLWTASKDKTVKCLSRATNWEEDTSLEHPDYVLDVVVDEVGGHVVTACRDEEVRVFDKGTGKLVHVFSGHYEEVTGLVLLDGQKVVSVSIDGTVRQWSLKAPDLAKAIQEAEDERAGKGEDKVEEKKESLLTAEEEAELAELMGDSD
ncbi:WD repeat protein [Lophiotrema nucula]|uniref:WD repeat protein n=1 Tax=Lophiotrema nucula TaxID=690887 RepID=A0A6A5ZHA6_9PLEO|nr:WD repeat protein [Lophiotrema nucula]